MMTQEIIKNLKSTLCSRSDGTVLVWAKVMEEGAKQVMLEIRANCMPQVDALIAAGWKFELPEIVNRKDGESRMGTEPWQWYWRRPPRRKGSKGMKFWSTSMAFNALKREAQNDPSSATASHEAHD